MIARLMGETGTRGTTRCTKLYNTAVGHRLKFYLGTYALNINILLVCIVYFMLLLSCSGGDRQKIIRKRRGVYVLHVFFFYG